MLIIAGSEIKPDALTSQHQLTEVEQKILESMSSANYIYRYTTQEELFFELGMRKHIIDASTDLYKSGIRFRTFRETICNENFWDRTEEGGFSLKEGIKPSDAIEDIFRRGRSYGTECATAIVIVYYKAVLDMFKPELFDQSFEGIYLMNWQHVNKHLGVVTYRDLEEYFPGDCRYFANPDVNPLTPEWQGENAIDLGNGQYYGHGIGITSGDGIIRALNQNRISGSEVSAHLLNTATRPDFKKLYALSGSTVTALE